MNKEPAKISCEEFQKQLPELIASGRDLVDHSHLRSCELCRTLVDDLDRIAEESRRLRGGFGSEG